jgi:hypothetical protein
VEEEVRARLLAWTPARRFTENGRLHGQKIVDTIAARLEQLG